MNSSLFLLEFLHHKSYQNKHFLKWGVGRQKIKHNELTQKAANTLLLHEGPNKTQILIITPT